MRFFSLVLPTVEFVMRGLRSRLAKAGGLVLSATILSGAMGTAALLLTIRHLSLEAFGILTVALTTMQLVGMFSNFGLNETLITLVSRAESSEQRYDVKTCLSAILQLRLIITAVVIAAGFLLARPIAEHLFHQPELGVPLRLSVLGACGVSLCQFSLTALQASRSYVRYAVVGLVRSSSILMALAILAAFGHLTLTAALYVNIAAPFLAFATSPSLAHLGLIKIDGSLLQFTRQIWSFSKWISIQNLCSMFFSRLEIYFLTAFASPAVLGIYSVAFKLCGGILVLEATNRTVLFPEIARRAGTPKLSSFARGSLGALTILGGLVWGLGVLASPLIPTLLGAHYAASVPIFLVLLTARALYIPLTPLVLLFFATDQTRSGAHYALFQLLLLVGVGLLLIPNYGAKGAAWTQVVVAAAAVGYVVIFAWPYLARPLPKQG